MSSDGDWTEAGSAESKGALPRMAPSGPLFDAALRLPSSEVLAPVCLDEVELDGCSLLLEEEVYVRSLERVGFTREKITSAAVDAHALATKLRDECGTASILKERASKPAGRPGSVRDRQSELAELRFEVARAGWKDSIEATVKDAGASSLVRFVSRLNPFGATATRAEEDQDRATRLRLAACAERAELFLEGVLHQLETGLVQHNSTTSSASAELVVLRCVTPKWGPPRALQVAYSVPWNGHGYFMAALQSRSSGGEVAQSQLAVNIFRSEFTKTSPRVPLLCAAVGPGGRHVLLVEREVGALGSGATWVYVHPARVQLSRQHEKAYIPSLACAAAAYEPTTRMLALLFYLSASEAKLALYTFDSDFQKLDRCEKRLQVDGAIFSASGELVGSMPCVLLPQAALSAADASFSSKMALILEPGCIRIFNAASNGWEPEKLEVETSGRQWLVTPSRVALLALYHCPAQHAWLLDAYALEESAGDQQLFHPILHAEPLPPALSSLPAQGVHFAANSMGGKTYLVAAHGDHMHTVELDIQSVVVANSLQSSGEELDPTASTPPVNRLLNYVYSTCERFPMDDCLSIAEMKSGGGSAGQRRDVKLQMCTGDDAHAKKLVDYVQELLDEVEEITQKPMGKTLGLVPRACPDAAAALADSHPAQLGGWVQRAMCVVPLQISRCAGNTLEPMHDGEPQAGLSSEDDDIVELSKQLRLGLYEFVLNGHESPVVTVCALGQQSVGKSYQLNHLGRVFFDVAGGRCTDGVWLSARPFVDSEGVTRLALMLDCEGIGSLERTETEDMLHCLLVGAVSSLTMFKTHFVFNRELDDTLKRLDKGAQKVADIRGASGERLIFRGSIRFCLKDVQRAAMRPTLDEFAAKLNDRVQARENFVSTIYSNEVSLTAFPQLGRHFFKTLQECAEELRAAECPAFKDGKQALYIIKLMLLKMAHKDWTPIDRQWITSQAKRLRTLIPIVCHFGATGTLSNGSLAHPHPLKLGETADAASSDDLSFDCSLPRESLDAITAAIGATGSSAKLEVEMSDAAEDESGAGLTRCSFRLALKDHDLRLGLWEAKTTDGMETIVVDGKSVEEDLARLRALVAALLGLDRHDKDPLQFRSLHAVVGKLAEAALKRREHRATRWLAAAVSEFADSPEASELLNAQAVAHQRLEAAWALCGATCGHCHLPCTAVGRHSEHDCSTDHTCKALCGFCEEEGSGVVHVCKERAGHGGRHLCAAVPHTCGRACALAGALNCRGGCRREPMHGGECDCGSGNHLCGQKCALPGCEGRCTVPYGAEHERHQCGDEACPERCPLCDRRCPGAHFHGVEDPSALHLCGREHACIDPSTHTQRLCGCTGVCAIQAQLQRVEQRVFRGKRGEFKYEHVTRQIVKRDVCTRKIPPGALAHDGPCCCSLDEDAHFCAHECPACLYRCTRPHGHNGRRKMNHGNLENTVFYSNREEFELDGRKYARGDAGVAETCDSFCTRSGRGHIHILPCNRHLCGSALHDGVRHHADNDVATAPSHAAQELDEYTHDTYWEKLNIEDPCVDAERAAFKMCGATCMSGEHQGPDGVQQVHCLLPLWHEPLDPRAKAADHLPPGHAHGYISSDGHLFPCRHVTAAFVHTFMVIDRSGSMASSIVRPDNLDIRHHPHFAGLDNVLGVVYEAALKYVRERSVRCPHDLLTLIPFCERAHVEFASQDLSDVPQLLARMMTVKPEGWTDFSQALAGTYAAVQQWRQQTSNHKPIIIMLTDSQDCNSTAAPATLQQIMALEAQLPEEEQLALHMIGFGPGVNEAYISQLASIGNGSYLVCQTGSDVDRLDLVRAFSRLAAQPALKVSLMQAVRVPQ